MTIEVDDSAEGGMAQFLELFTMILSAPKNFEGIGILQCLCLTLKLFKGNIMLAFPCHNEFSESHPLKSTEI